MISLAVLLVPFLAAAAGPAADARDPARPGSPRVRVAFLEIRPLGAEAHKAELLSEVALTEASSLEALEVIGRSDVISILGFEQQKRALGCAEDAACLAEVAGALGASYLLVGTLGTLDTLYRIDLKLLEARQARVVGRVGESVEGSERKLVASVQAAVRKLLGPVSEASLASQRAAAALRLPAGADGKAPAPGRTWAWAATGASGALLAGGIAAGLVGRSKTSSIEASRGTAGYAATYERLAPAARTWNRRADLLFGGALVAGGVATWLWLRTGPAAPAPGGRLSVVPALGPGELGLALSGSL